MRMRAERKQRKAERKYGDTEGHCMTPGSWHVQHPGLGMFDIRVSARSTPGSRHVRHPGVRHKKKANGTNDTGRKRYGNMQRKERQKEKVSTNAAYFLKAGAKVRTLFHIFQMFPEVFSFCFFKGEFQKETSPKQKKYVRVLTPFLSECQYIAAPVLESGCKSRTL